MDSMLFSPLFNLFLTLAAFRIGLWVYARSDKQVLLHPVLIGGLLIAFFLYSFDISYTDYSNGNQLLYFLLGPATVALAVPLSQQFHHIRRLAGPITMTVTVGGVFAIISALGLAWISGASSDTLLALTPKSVTTPIAIGIAEKITALPSLVTGIVVLTGVVGTIMSPFVFKIFQLNDPRLQGIVLGINAHGVGTARAFELNPLCGAFASLSMGLTGACTAILLPFIIQWVANFF